MPIIKNHELENNKILNCDICVIGSGLSAQMLASKLAHKKIIIVESGKIDFNEDVQKLNYLKDEGKSFRKNNINRLRQLGGSANLWANQLMTLDEFDISHRDWVTDDFGWPLDFHELKLLYQDVIQNLYKKNFEKIDFFDEIKMINKDFLLENEFAKNKLFYFNRHFWPGNIDKFNLKTKFTKNLLNKKNIVFLENFTATTFNIDNDKQYITNLVIKSKNKTCEINSNKFVLACGAIENARIILNNGKSNKIFQNENTGRYFMDHPRAILGFIKSNKKLPLSSLIGLKKNNYQFRTSLKLSNKIQTENKILSSFVFIEPKYTHEDEIFFEKILFEIKKIVKLKGFPNINFKELNLKKLFEQIYLKLPPQLSNSKINNILYKFFCFKNYKFSFNEMEVKYQAEQFPDYQNKVYLNNEKDIFDQNYCSINWQLNKTDFKTQNIFSKTLESELKTSKILKFIKNDKIDFEDASHHSGTTRISKDRSDGVVDKNCKFHDIKNLYIIGNSIFRTSGSANPGLTNMAISARLGEYLQTI